jgi:hypothetical protein
LLRVEKDPMLRLVGVGHNRVQLDELLQAGVIVGYRLVVDDALERTQGLFREAWFAVL